MNKSAKKGLIIAALVLLPLLAVFYLSGYSSYWKFRSLINNAKYPNATYWKPSYTASTVDESAGESACFDSQDSPSSVLSYYQKYFQAKGWRVNNSSGFSFQSPDTQTQGTLTTNGSGNCKFNLSIW